MNNEFTIEEINEYKKELQKTIDRADALRRLENNADYKTVFIEGYAENESKRLVLMLGDPLSDNRNAYIEQMIGVAQFVNYTRAIKQLAEQAFNALENTNQAEKEYYEGTE